MQEMTKGGAAGHLLRYAVPLMLGNWFQLAYNAVDSIIAGRFIGKDALAAEGIAGPLRVKIFGGLYKPDAARLKKVVVLRALASEFVGAGVDETDILFNELIAFSSVHRRALL